MALSAYSQNIIPRVGLSLSSINMGEGFVAPDYQTEYRSGIVAGAEADVSFNEKIGLAVSLLYNQKGWNGKWTYNTVAYEDEVRLDYVDMAVMPKVKFKPFYFMVGPVVGIGVGGKTLQRQYVTNGPVVEEGKPGFDNKFNFAGQLAFGVIIRKRTFIDIRYQKSFTNYFDAVDDTPSKLKSIQLTTGFLFGKKP